jgi:pimeloyl-ACP methyl ester carboxylesterase
MPPPLLFIHGSCSQPAHWEPWLGCFRAAGYECVAPALPGRAPVDLGVLARSTFDDFAVALAKVHAAFDRPPIVIGYSMGGLLAQRLAATAECAGLVLLAAATPFLRPPRWRMIPYGLPFVWPVLTGQPFRVGDEALRELVLHHLAVAEQDELLRDVVPESGRAFRRVALGLVRVRARDVRCPVLCVTGSEDRVLAPAATRRLAKRYGADLLIVPGCGHFPAAGSLVSTVAVPVRAWIERIAKPADPSFRSGRDL